MELITPNLTQLLFLTIHARQDEREEYEAIHGVYDAEGWAMSLHAMLGRGPSHVFIDKAGVPYYAAGVAVVTPYVAQTWSVGTEEWRPHALEVTRVCRRVISKTLRTTVHRVQIMVMATRKDANLWCRALGAHRECVLRRYGMDGQDFEIHAAYKGGL